MDWIGTAIILIGLWLIGSKKRIGFLFSAVGSVLWIAYGIRQAIPSIIAVNAVFILVHTRAWRNWGDKPEPHQQPETSWRKSLKYILPLAALILLFLFVPPTRAPFVDWFGRLFRDAGKASPVKVLLTVFTTIVAAYGIVWGRYRFQLEYISREVNNIMLMMRDSDDDSLMRRAISMIPRVQGLQAYKTPGLSPISWLADPEHWYYPWTWKWATEPNQYRETLIGIIEDAAVAEKVEYEVRRTDGFKMESKSNRKLLEALTLNNAYLLSANLKKGHLVSAVLQDTNFELANLDEANLSGSLCSNANLSGASLKNANLRYAILFEANLRNTNLRSANIERAHFMKANLSGAVLSKANFRGANLAQANLEMANLQGACFDQANLTGACLKGAKTKGASFKGAILSGTILEGKIEDGAAAAD